MNVRKDRCIAACLAASTLGLGAHSAEAALLVFQNDLAGFEAAAGPTAVALDFDALATGTDLAGATEAGMTFSSPGGNTLEVVRGDDTFTPGGFAGAPNPGTNKLFPTSGENVLSPGGLSLVPGPALAEHDSLTIDLSTPIAAFGIDVLFQSLDCCSFTTYSLVNSVLGVTVGGGNVAGGAGGGGQAGGSTFIGFYSDDPGTHFDRVIFTETDGNAQFPDSNIGFDTIRLASPASAVPEPASFALVGLALAGFVSVRMRRTRRIR